MGAPVSSQVALLCERMSAAFLWRGKGAFSGVASQVIVPVAGSIERCAAVVMQENTRSSCFSAGKASFLLWLPCYRH